jgi:hypothetical protein
MPVIALSMLTACAGSIGSVEPPLLGDPPPKLTTECAKPSLLPERELTQKEVEFYWINDRENLIRCGIQLADLVSFYRDRDGALTDG